MTQGFFNIGIEEGGAMRKEASDGGHERLKKARGSQRLRSRQRWTCDRCRGPSEGPKGAETNESDGYRRFGARVRAVASNTHSGRQRGRVSGGNTQAIRRHGYGPWLGGARSGKGRSRGGCEPPGTPRAQRLSVRFSMRRNLHRVFSNSGESPSVRPLVSTSWVPHPPPPCLERGR